MKKPVHSYVPRVCPHGREFPAECPDCKAAFVRGIDEAVRDPAPEPLRRVAEEWLVSSSPPSIDRLTRLLEYVVRECAEASCECGDPQCSEKGYVLRRFGLDPES